MDTLYTVNEAARYFKVSRMTIYRWMAAGQLRYVLVGHDRRIRESDLKAFIRPAMPTR